MNRKSRVQPMIRRRPARVLAGALATVFAATAVSFTWPLGPSAAPAGSSVTVAEPRIGANHNQVLV